MIDLQADQLQIVRSILTTHLPQVPVFAFGSRVSGKAKKFSDLDLMLRSDAKLDWTQIARVREAFEDSALPIMVDLVDWHGCNPNFQAIIEPQLEPLSI
jgi:predicted nucleotidyltransferase